MALAVSAVIAAVLIFQASELWLASHRLDSEKVAFMERGAALVPGDGSAWDRLGRLRQWDFVDSDLPGAIEDYRKAVRDDPRSAHFWMDLASAYEASGDAARAQTGVHCGLGLSLCQRLSRLLKGVIEIESTRAFLNQIRAYWPGGVPKMPSSVLLPSAHAYSNSSNPFFPFL